MRCEQFNLIQPLQAKSLNPPYPLWELDIYGDDVIGD